VAAHHDALTARGPFEAFGEPRPSRPISPHEAAFTRVPAGLRCTLQSEGP
jgi:hypothetical protein